MALTRDDIARLIVSMAVVLFGSAAAWAQQVTSIAGAVRDTSGAVIPGVTVEVTSPALIEKVRTVITDGQGQYRVVDLRPGTYAVTFTLTGFSTVKREGIELTSGFTATVNAEMRPGALEETIVVTGTSPLVDTQNVRRQVVISNEVLEALPTTRGSVTAVSTLIPGLTAVADVGGSAGVYVGQTVGGVSYHGNIGVKRQFDGVRVQQIIGSGTGSGYIVSPAFAEEVVVETGGASAESPSSGVLINSIPREGGNVFRFSASGLFSNDSLQSNNLSDELRARGLTTVNKVLHIFDGDAALGGPIKRDRLWFYAGFRGAASKQQLPGVFFNKTQGTPFYTPDLARPAYRQEHLESLSIRLTWQASPRNKVNIHADTQYMCACRHQVGVGFAAPETVPGFKFWPSGFYQVAWSLPLTTRLLFEAGAAAVIFHWPNFRQPETGPDDISIVEQRIGFRYNSGPFGSVSYGPKETARYVQRFAVSYVSGSHAYKAGIQSEEGFSNATFGINHGVEYQFLDGKPTSINQFAIPYRQKERMKADLGLYAQDTWTVKRLTLNYGLRFDYMNAYVPEQHVPAGPWVPARDFAPLYNVPNWTDLSPRLGGSYDLFGNGKTAVKASLGRYPGVSSVEVASALNPMVTSVNSVNRLWNDLNGNYVPDCDLANLARNGECGAINNPNFGNLNITTRWADDVVRGFGHRPYNWDFATEVQHELIPGMAITGGYYRNSFGNFRVTDNLDVSPEDYSPYCITAPTGPRNGFSLPNGGGYQVCGLFDIVPAKFGLARNLVVTQASNFGKQTQISDFFNVRTQTRFRSGLQFGGGLDTGRTVNDNCFVVDSPQQLLNCRVVTPFRAQTEVKVHGSYPLPGEFVVSGVYRNVVGPNVTATYTATNREIAPFLGRNLAACRSATIDTCTATAPVPLLEPQTLFEARRSQLDLRVSKAVTIGSTKRLYANFDVFNVLNADSITAVNNSFGSLWRRPTTLHTTGAGVLDGRLLQFSARLTF